MPFTFVMRPDSHKLLIYIKGLEILPLAEAWEKLSDKKACTSQWINQRRIS